MEMEFCDLSPPFILVICLHVSDFLELMLNPRYMHINEMIYCSHLLTHSFLYWILRTRCQNCGEKNWKKDTSWYFDPIHTPVPTTPQNTHTNTPTHLSELSTSNNLSNAFRVHLRRIHKQIIPLSIFMNL